MCLAGLFLVMVGTALPPTGVGAPSPTASIISPVPPPGPTPRYPRRLPLYVGAAVVVVVVVLLVLVFVLPSSPSSAVSNSGPQGYGAALGPASAAVSGFDGGGWFPLFAAGLDSSVSYTAPLNLSLSGISDCNVTLAPGVSGDLTLPAFAGNRSAGIAPIWEFAYRNGADQVAVVSVINGAATVLGTLSGKCTTYLGFLSPLPSDAIGSQQAAAAVAPFAQSFLTADPNASALFGIVGGVSLLGVGAEWEVEYSTCSFESGTGLTGSVFNATVNATTGSVIHHESGTGISCGSSSGSLLAQAPGNLNRPAGSWARPTQALSS